MTRKTRRGTPSQNPNFPPAPEWPRCEARFLLLTDTIGMPH
jgi:hypothetical protein